MSGEELKAKLNAWGVNLMHLSKNLGYENDQRLHSNLKAADIKSGLLERIASILGKTISEMYGENDAISKDSKGIVDRQSKIIDSQQKTIDRLTKLLEQWAHSN